MPLRCLLFSSHEEIVEPIWKVLSDLGIEGEYCRSAVDAVEKVTTQPFQIVMTDWDDQPEAAFLLKTARDLKAAQRPLTLAIVSDDARLPEALRAGANSVLAKPIRPEQVRDTMSTACQLLRAKQQPSAQQSGAPGVPRQAAETGTRASAAAAAAPAPATEAPDDSFPVNAPPPRDPASFSRAQSYKEVEVKPIEELPEASVIATSEPKAATADATTEQEPKPKEKLTGWSMLQARLNAPVFGTGKEASAKTELLTYGETPSYGTRAAGVRAAESPKAELPTEEVKPPAKAESKQEAESEAALFAYISGKAEQEAEPAAEARPKSGKVLLFAIVAVAGVIFVMVPRARQSLLTEYRNAVRTGSRWLNPPPAPLPEAAPQHDSFGQSGDEYKLPAVGNIPDATTDPSQIQVLPVVDPTAKPEKGSEANSGQAQGAAVENNSPSDQSQAAPVQTTQGQSGTSVVKDPTLTSVGSVPENSADGPDPFLAQKPVQQPAQMVASQLAVPPPVRTPPATHTASAGGSMGIPSSLKSQLAPATPESSGAKPVEAAMSSIEPVNLPETATRELLAQAVDPDYPAGAKASAQRGSVVLQVLIGRDGTVQDAKFLQGSLVFARAAIDAVRQWRFKPYSMNGRAVAVQSTITLTFKPPA